MSNRDSLGFGELLPQDVVDIFAQEKNGKRGQKKRSHSLGRALVWLKGKNRKDLGAKGQRLGLGPALDLACDRHPAGHQGGHKGGHKSGRQAHPQAVPKRDDDKTPAQPLFQENVFIEGSRPEYLENLHTEALEGLKMMQQEETNYGVEFQDNESTISVHTDGECGGFMTDSTIGDSSSVVSVQSSASTRSSRSGLTRQGSTFRPLNSGKKSEKTKTRRRHRKTVGGIPQHVQRELGLDRVGWSLTQRLDEEHLYNGESDDSPTTYRPEQAAESQIRAGASLQDMNAIHPLNKNQLQRLGATHAGHRDDLALLHRLAIPSMTTANSLQPEPPSPVMSMSPQAAYMSKIIPNAVLPPSIDVVEISRGRSRNSVRTISKSSLLLSSPAPSRASSRASSSRNTSSRASTITSASRNNNHNMSDSSCWSNSESSDTLVSDSSTISSSSTPRQKRSQDGDASAKEDRISVHSSISKASKCNSNGKLIVKGDEIKKEGPFGRSLSIMKPKRAPPPPSRSYSLHNKMKRRSRDLAEVRVNSRETSLNNTSASGEENEKNTSGSCPVPSSPEYNADTSSLDDSMDSVSFSPIRSQLLAQRAERAAKVEVSKDASQEKKEPLQENKLSKIISPSSGYSSQDGTSSQVSKEPHSSSPRHKRGILAKLQRLFPGSTPAASTASPLPQQEGLKHGTTVDTVSPSVRALRELFNIPPPPKVHAPPPPPPEVWAHSKRSFELLLGPPAPDNLYAIIKKNPKDRRQQRQSPSASAEGSVKSLVVERKHKNPAVTVESINGAMRVRETKNVQESGILSAEILKGNHDRLAEQNVDLKGNSNVTNNEKVRVIDIINGMLVKAVEKREGRLAVVREEEVKPTSTQASEVKTNMDVLPAILLARVPPSPSPPPAHHPPYPPTTSVVVSPELSWPPPPPPLAKAGLNSPDEIDFPLPPPPMFGEVGLVSPVQVPPEKSIPGGDSSCTTTSVVSVVITEAEPKKPSTSQGIAAPPLSIPPPPPYTAPPPPVKVVSPPMTKKVSPPSPPKKVSPPPPKEMSSPPPPKEMSPPPKKVSPPSPKEVSPPPPKDMSPLPSRKEVSPPPPKEMSPLPPPKEVSPPPPKEVSPPPPKEVSPPPPKEMSPLPPPKEVSPPPPKEMSPLPPPKEVSPPPPKEVSPPPPKEVSPPPPKEMSPLPPPKEVSPPPPKEMSPLPPPKEVSPPPPKEVSPPPPKEASPPPLIEVSPVRPKEAPPPHVNDVSVTLVTVVSPPVEEVSTLSTVEVSPPSQENACQSSEEATPVRKLTPPQSISPPPPLPSQPNPPEQEIDLPQESIPSKSEGNPVSYNSILTPPQSIPPPPPIQLLNQPSVEPQNTDGLDGPANQEPSLLPEVSIPPEKAEEPDPSPTVNIPLPPPLTVQGLASIKERPSPASTENQTPELVPAPVQEAGLNVSPSLLQMVKLRSVNSSPEPPKAQEPPEAEVMMRKQQPSNLVPPSSSSGEAPQKPIRRSLIILSPPTASSPPTSPPATVTAQPALSQSVLVPPVSSSPVVSPTKKSPPATTASPSINLQEAIRLRTAARSKASPTSRLSLQSPTSPLGPCKSPSSTASFIFSKSNKKVVIETKPVPENMKVASETEWVRKGVKVPPPVARKPKTKGKEIETSEGTEQTAGQEAPQESIKDAAEKTNGTAGSVKGGETPPT
ncbi:uncharacterized protein KIAA1522-like isoform X2 [Cottoperca gobio]|uniref:Uncharacterized protein KIAA1522-like isoform X2 n=1 Tax=Cottoperca gobio TaxID=56716 RepID=A0A6J2S3M8_COTGO|nr:uncharacterized protein KIAA1522-like isoform X2 [Cottoperca gobio]